MQIRAFYVWAFCCIAPIFVSYQTLAKPLVLQYEVSHSRQTDQMSLIFLEDEVKLVVNTSSWQETKTPRLGQFRSPLTPELSSLKGRLEGTYVNLQKYVSMADLVSLPPSHPVPHAPLLRLSDQELESSHPQFDSLAKIIYSVWETADWTCLDCARYKKRRNKILRKVTVRSQNPEGKTKATSHSTKFSQKELSCHPKGSKNLECVDPQYGIFEL